MQAIIETGSKQYLVKEGEEILVEKLKGEAGSDVVIEKVFLIIDGEKVLVGQPVVEKAKVTAKLVGQEKGKKQVIFKFRRREHYKRKIGHRQQYTRIKIEKIEK